MAVMWGFENVNPPSFAICPLAAPAFGAQMCGFASAEPPSRARSSLADSQVTLSCADPQVSNYRHVPCACSWIRNRHSDMRIRRRRPVALRPVQARGSASGAQSCRSTSADTSLHESCPLANPHFVSLVHNSKRSLPKLASPARLEKKKVEFAALSHAPYS